MLVGYNTNGFSNHSLLSAIDIIGKLGYRSIAITLDFQALNPHGTNLDREIAQVRKRLASYDLECVIETGARFLLDPWRKHKPDLLNGTEDERKIRVNFLKKAIDIASMLGAGVVSYWSGSLEQGVSEKQAMLRLARSSSELAEYALPLGVVIGFEPEPGMLVENMAQYVNLRNMVGHDNFKLTLDIGHAFITETEPLEACIHAFKDEIVNIHLEDMKKEKHQHLFFGRGEIDFIPVFRSLEQIKYHGPVNIELSRHSHKAVETATMAKKVIEQLLQQSHPIF